MATTVTLPTPNIHWLTYPLLVGGLVFGLWLWHDTAIKDQASVVAVATAKTTQATTDKQVTSADSTAQDTLKQQNAVLQAQLTAAKTLSQQIAFVNTQLNTHISQTPGPNPSSTDSVLTTQVPTVTIPASEIPEIAKQAVDFKEAQNQVAADQIQIAGDKEQIASRDNTIKADDSEITTLKGGSHFKRFLKGAEHVAIGVGVGVVVGYALHK
jgi:hypothetical protein